MKREENVGTLSHQCASGFLCFGWIKPGIQPVDPISQAGMVLPAMWENSVPATDGFVK
jgi:hypothetical protein